MIRSGDGLRRRGETPSDETAMRLAAFLQLTDARGAALLCGRYASHALLVAGLSETPLVLANAAPDVPPDAGAAITGEVFGRIVPLDELLGQLRAVDAARARAAGQALLDGRAAVASVGAQLALAA